MRRRYLLSLLCLAAFSFTPEAHAQRGGYPPGLYPGSPIYRPSTSPFRRYKGDGRWARVRSNEPQAYESMADRYDNNQGRFRLRSSDERVFYRPGSSPYFRYPNHPVTSWGRASFMESMQTPLYR